MKKKSVKWSINVRDYLSYIKPHHNRAWMWSLESAEKRRCSVTMQLEFDSQFFMSIVFLGFAGLLCYLYTFFVEKQKRLRSKLMKQGITGPPSTILLGNILELQKFRSSTSKSSSSSSSQIPSSHNCAALLLPIFDKWRDQYGIICVSFS